MPTITMLILDLLLLCGALLLACWRLFAPTRHPRYRLTAATAAALLAVVQWTRHGVTWQHVPAYLLLVYGAWPFTQTAGRKFGRVVVGGVMVIAVTVWMLPAVPAIPVPTGPHAIGTRIYRWTDSTRDEPNTSETRDRRDVIVQAWYPVSDDAPSGHVRLGAPNDSLNEARPIPYLDGVERLPRRVTGVPGFLLRRYGQIDTHAAPGAALAPSDRPWPVVLFLPGYGAPRAVYTGLITQLASRGFVVLAVDHPYEAAVTQLPDGRVVGTRERILPGERDRLGYMARQQDVRVADVRFVLDRLAREPILTRPGARMEVTRVAVVGHSFGGAAASAVSTMDARVVAAVNIDGTPYGDLPTRVLSRPFLLVQSDHRETAHSAYFVRGNGALLARSTAGRFHYEITRANHYSFTDVPLFVAAPIRALLARVVGGTRGPAATQQVTVELLVAFLRGPLTGTPADLATIAARLPGVIAPRLGQVESHVPSY